MLASESPRLLSATNFGKASLDWVAGVQAPPEGLLAQCLNLGNRDGTARRRSARITPLVATGTTGHIVLYRLWLVWWFVRSPNPAARADLCRLISLGAGSATAGANAGDGVVIPAGLRRPSDATFTIAADGNQTALATLDAPAAEVIKYGASEAPYPHVEVLIPDCLGAAAVAVEIAEGTATEGNAIVESFT